MSDFSRRSVLRLAGIALAAPAVVRRARAADPLQIGVLTDLSGVTADAFGPGSVAGAQIAVEEAGGSVLGRPVEVIAGDHQYKPEVGAALARRWIDADGVEVVADIASSAVALATVPVVDAKGKIALVSGAGSQPLFGRLCSPTHFVWTLDAAAYAGSLIDNVQKAGPRKWFLLGLDYSFGHEVEAAARARIAATGGTLAGSATVPIGNADFAGPLSQAAGLGADAMALTPGGHDLINLVKQAREFGLMDGRISFAFILAFLTDFTGAGLDAMSGGYAVANYYWDRNDGTRELAARFARKIGRPPNQMQAGVYSSVRHYLKPVEAAGTVDARQVASTMRQIPLEDVTVDNALIRSDGRVAFDLHVMQAKAPGESRSEWDVLKPVETIPRRSIFPERASDDCKAG